MLAPRRFLPSVTALLAFEAAARLGSATKAAAELSLTQSAISRQIKVLEDQLGVSLMAREGRSLVLTPVGTEYVRAIREVLTQLAQASVAARTTRQSGTLTLAILPAFGMHWLAPRLRDFAETYPEVTVNLSTRLSPFSFGAGRFDAAIHFGHEDWPGVDYLPLMPETVVPVCAPDLLTEPVGNPAQVLDYPLLHLETRPRAWSRWLAATGHQTPATGGMMFDQFATMAQAAMHGLGIALLPTFVAHPYLAGGQLALAATQTSESVGNYYLVWPQDRPTPPALVAFRDWIGAKVASEKISP